MDHFAQRPEILAMIKPLMLRAPLILGLVIAIGGANIPAKSSAETWTNLRGTNSIEAEMVGLWGNKLVLDMGDGRRVAVSLDDLRAESRIQAQRLANAIDEAREARIGELRLQAASAAAPSPDPLPQPLPASSYVPAKTNGDVAAQFSEIDEQLRAGHLLAIFDALPESFQKDLDELTKLAATKVSGIAWQSLVGSAQQLGDAIVTKQNWFFSHPRFDVAKSATPEQTKRLNETILSLANILRSGIDVDEFELSKIQNIPLRDWLAERDAAIAPHLAEIFKQSDIEPPQFSVEKSKGKTTAIQVSMPTSESAEPVTKTIPISLVDEVAVPTSIADAWKTLIPENRKLLEAADDGSLLADPASVVLFSAIGPLVNPLQQAQNRNDFHAAMQPLIEIAVPMLQSLKTNLGSSF